MRVFQIITKASRHMYSLFAYITSLQHNIISYFSFYKIQPANELVIFGFFVNTLEICLLSFFSSLIYQQIYVWCSCFFVFSICVYTVFVLINKLSTVQCMVNFCQCMVKNERYKKDHFQRLNKCIFNKNLQKLGLEFSLNVL